MSRKSRVIVWWAALLTSSLLVLTGHPQHLARAGFLLLAWTLVRWHVAEPR